MALVNTLDPARAAAVLTRWWACRHPDRDGIRVTDVNIPRSSGMSSETILFRVESPDGFRELVARLIAPERNLFPGFDLEVERQAMTAARASTGVPAPRVEAVELDPSLFGAPFLVMERLHGEVPADDPPYTASGWLLERGPAEQALLYDNAVAVLGRMADADVRALPDTTLGHPARGASALDQHLDYWEHFHTWSARGRSHPVLEHGLQWLRRHRPDDERRPLLSWGDSRLGNLMFGPDNEVTGVLDWEMTGLGPPELDLSWFLVTNRLCTDGMGLPSPPGFPDRERTIARYVELTGRAVRDLEYHEVFAAVRLTVILLRLGHVMIDAGLLPADHALPVNNPPTHILAAMLDVEVPSGDSGWFVGHR